VVASYALTFNSNAALMALSRSLESVKYSACNKYPIPETEEK